MSSRFGRPVVVGVAGSGAGDPALVWAVRTAAALGTSVTVVHVSDPEAVAARMAGAEVVAVSAVMDAEDETQEELRGTVAALSAEHGVEVQVETRRGSPVAALLEHQDDAALLVVGTGRKGAMEEFILGSTSLGVAAHAHCPVAVVNPGVDPASLTHGRLGVAVDGSRDSAVAAEVALALAERTGSTVSAISTWYLEVVDGYVVTEPDSPEWAQVVSRCTEALDRALTRARQAYPDVTVDLDVRRGPVVPTLKAAAQEWDAIVVGSRGLGSVQGRLLGSVSQRLMRSAPCPVIVARAG